MRLKSSLFFSPLGGILWSKNNEYLLQIIEVLVLLDAHL